MLGDIPDGSGIAMAGVTAIEGRKTPLPKRNVGIHSVLDLAMLFSPGALATIFNAAIDMGWVLGFDAVILQQLLERVPPVGVRDRAS